MGLIAGETIASSLLFRLRVKPEIEGRWLKLTAER